MCQHPRWCYKRNEERWPASHSPFHCLHGIPGTLVLPVPFFTLTGICFCTAANAWPIPCKYSYLRHIHGCNYLGNLTMLLQGISRHHFWMTTHLWTYNSPIYILHQVIWNTTYFHVGCGLVQRFWLTDSFSLKLFSNLILFWWIWKKFVPGGI